MHRLGAVGARDGLVALLDTLEREGEAPALAVDLEDADVDRVTLRDDLARVLDVVRRELGDVDEPLDAGKDLDEGAERDDLRDATLDDVVLAVALDHLLPRIGLRLLEAERDPLTVAVDVEHLHLDRLADVEHLGRVVHVAPAELGDVDEAVHAVEIDEGAEVDDVRDLTLDDVAGAQPVEDRLAHLLALVLEDGATGEDDVVARAVELDDLAAELLAEELVEVLHAPDVDERGGKEAAHAEVENETALDDLDHLAVDRLTGLCRGLDALPRELEAGALLREDEAPVGVLLRQDERVDLLAHRDLVGRVHRPSDRQLGDRDDAFGLVADVDEHLVLVDAHDRAVHDLALVDLREGSVVVRDELPVGACDPHPFFGGSRLFGDVVRHRIAEYSRMQRKFRSTAALPLERPRAHHTRPQRDRDRRDRGQAHPRRSDARRRRRATADRADAEPGGEPDRAAPVPGRGGRPRPRCGDRHASPPRPSRHARRGAAAARHPGLLPAGGRGGASRARRSTCARSTMRWDWNGLTHHENARSTRKRARSPSCSHP